jgi:hypothetical protein
MTSIECHHAPHKWIVYLFSGAYKTGSFVRSLHGRSTAARKTNTIRAPSEPFFLSIHEVVTRITCRGALRSLSGATERSVCFANRAKHGRDACDERDLPRWQITGFLGEADARSRVSRTAANDRTWTSGLVRSEA